MSRQLFLHHYFPALYFGILLTASIFDIVTAWMKPKIRLQVTGVVVVMAIWTWYHFSPLSYGDQWTRGKCESAKWVKTWDFSWCVVRIPVLRVYTLTDTPFDAATRSPLL